MDVTPSQANFVWLAVPGLSGTQLADALSKRGVIVAPGGPLGADDHIRASIRHAAGVDRLLEALEGLLEDRS